jgi:hypothetical protein
MYSHLQQRRIRYSLHIHVQPYAAEEDAIQPANVQPYATEEN